MTATVRITTIVIAAVLFLFGGITGFRLLTSSADPVDAAPTCKRSVIAAGSDLDSNVVKVNVFNASSRSGLANRVTINLQANGFLGGQIGNSTSATTPRRVAILTNNPDDPRVKLVAAQFRDKVEYAKPDITVTSGVTVVVGDRYRGLKSKAITTVKTDQAIPVCVPVVPLA